MELKFRYCFTAEKKSDYDIFLTQKIIILTLRYINHASKLQNFLNKNVI